jgi:hypothetical protein
MLEDGAALRTASPAVKSGPERAFGGKVGEDMHLLLCVNAGCRKEKDQGTGWRPWPVVVSLTP